ncbi:MAG TPA: AI-2E family transporter [Candidatus Stackebrandtia faecavium]|nr:AI-2E family transporter [Candidatus Stackebrandtia faecavium]
MRKRKGTPGPDESESDAPSPRNSEAADSSSKTDQPESEGAADGSEDAEAKSAKGFGSAGKPFAKTSFHHGLYAGIGLAVAYVLFISVEIALPFLIIIVVSGFLAIGLNPLVVRVQRFGLPRGLSVAIVCLLVLLILCGGIVALVPPIMTEGAAFVEALPSYVQDLAQKGWVQDLIQRFDLQEKLTSALAGIDSDTVFNAAGGLATVLGVAVTSVFNTVMIVLLTVYFLVAFDRLKGGFYRLLPAPRRERAKKLGDEMLAKVGSYTVGALGIGLTAGCSSFVFMLAAGVPYAYALAFVVAILDLIPQIGATLGAVVVTLVGLTVSIWVAIACVAFFVIYQQLENWLIYPTIMRRSVKVSDLGAILGLLIGTALLGIVGALLAVPTVAAIQLIVREVYIPRQDLA